MNKLISSINRNQWIAMKYDDFIRNFVEPLNMMDKNNFKLLIQNLNYTGCLEYLIQKCWEEQDKTPNEFNSNGFNSDHYNDAYEETLPIVLLLEKILSNRISTEKDSNIKTKLTQQLGLVSVILSPHKLEKFI